MSDSSRYHLGYSVIRALRRGPLTASEEASLDRLEAFEGTREDLLAALDVALWRGGLSSIVELIQRTLGERPEREPQLRLWN